MVPVIREARPSDEDAVVAVSLLAWKPVFAALRQGLGDELFRRLRGDWRASQAADVREVLTDPEQRVWVADDDGRAVGFVAAKLHRGQRIGEIYMIAVDPIAQQRGIGTALAETATEWLRQSGMSTAMIETGGGSRSRPSTAPVREGRLRRAASRPLLQGAVGNAASAWSPPVS